MVLGLRDNGMEMTVATTWWKKEGLEPIVFKPNWEDDEGARPKLTRLLKLVDEKSRSEKIFILGISAGASLAMNVFLQRPEKIEKMVSLCGRLRMGFSKNIITRELQKQTLENKAFAESVMLLEKNVYKLKGKDKKRILTVSAKFGDELIPIETSQMVGAKNILIPTPEHILSIFLGLTFNFKPIKDFLLKK